MTTDEMNRAVELAPCPAECLHTVDRGGPYSGWRRADANFVRCATCGCCTEYFVTEAEAIAAWNRRTPAGWQDIASAPKDGTWFLGYWPACTLEDRIIATQWYDAGAGEPYWLDAPDSRDWTTPTHWQPLPAPPAKENNA